MFESLTEKLNRTFKKLKGQGKLSEKNYMITGYQVKRDALMCNIKPYLIPIMAKLEEHLKRIDLEA